MRADPSPALDRVPTRFEAFDDRFAGVDGDAWVEVLHTGCRWTEGPLYVPAGRYVLFSDIPSDQVLRWDELTGAVGVLADPAGFQNGRTLDREGRVVSCEHGGRRVTRTEHDGTTTVLAERHEGRRLNSPNDVVVRADGSVWFTDPSYGIDSDYEGHAARSELGGCHVYRLDPGTGELRVVADDFVRPNGLAFSADERTLYIADTPQRHVRRFAVTEGSGLSGGEVVAECPDGPPDGLRLDSAGRVWVAAGEGLDCIDPDGTRLGRLHLPEVASNLVFGGWQRNQLFITATSSLYALRVKATGVQYPPAAV